MSHFDRRLRSQFFLTAPRPCPYLPGRNERKLFTHLSGPNSGELHDELSSLGFRRSQTIVYRPACVGCSACLSTRIRVADFAPSRSQKRVLKKNADLSRALGGDTASDEQYELFSRYLAARHADGGMTDMAAEDFAAMIEDTPVSSSVVEYRSCSAEPTSRNELIAACLTDHLSDGLSLVYSFFAPEAAQRSLGTYIILDHVALAAEMGLPYVYLGFWVRGSDKMDYKIQFQPAEVLAEDGWIIFE